MLNIDETSWKIFNFGEMTKNESELTHNYRSFLYVPSEKKKNQKRVFADCNEYFQLFITENGCTTRERFAQDLIWLRVELNEDTKKKIILQKQQK